MKKSDNEKLTGLFEHTGSPHKRWFVNRKDRVYYGSRQLWEILNHSIVIKDIAYPEHLKIIIKNYIL